MVVSNGSTSLQKIQIYYSVDAVKGAVTSEAQSPENSFGPNRPIWNMKERYFVVIDMTLEFLF